MHVMAANPSRQNPGGATLFFTLKLQGQTPLMPSNRFEVVG